MSGYPRAPNVSQYIANLNAIPAGKEIAQDQLGANIDDDLAYFTNAELFDFDLGGGEAHGQQAFNGNGANNGSKNAGGEFNGSYNFFEQGQQQQGQQQQQLALNTNFPSTENFDPQLFQSPQSATFPQHQQQQQEADLAAAPNQAAGNKRAHSVSSPAASVEDAARMAAEEDKRRRNTAASARFRVKKKQREAALEKTAKEMTDKVDALQKRVSELEMENKWLRGIVVEKGMNVKKEDDETKGDAAVERIADKHAKNGVGTESEA